MSEIIPSSTTSPPPPPPHQQPFAAALAAATAVSAPRSMPVRDDCWSEDATATLIEAWGKRYIDLNRGNLRQKQWQEVADTVNGRHGHIKKARRTDVQCKNRIDTLKKKYKIEKARVLDSNGSYKSPWPFFETLDHLIGSTMPIKKVLGSGSGSGSGSVAVSPSFSPPFGVPIQRSGGSMNMNHNVASLSNVNHNNGNNNNNNMMMISSVGMSTPILPQKRRAVSGSPPVVQGEEYFRRNYAEMAAAAAREEESEDESEEERVGGEEEEGAREEEEGDGDEEGEEREGDGIRKLAKVIEKFGEVYARVEREKQKQLIELEKQRMQFAKEMECQRMQMLVEMQVQLEKIKRAKRSNSDDMYS